MAMENMRRRLIEDANLYPEFGGPRKSRDSSPTIISSSASSSSVAVLADKSTIVVSSDDEVDELQDSEDDENPRPNPALPVKPPQPNNVVPFKPRVENSNVINPQLPTGKAKPAPGLSKGVDSSKFPPPKPLATPIHIPSNKDLHPSSQAQHRPAYMVGPKSSGNNFTVLPSHAKTNGGLGDGEIVAFPDFKDDNQFMSPADAEKALRDLMGGGMNEDVATEVNMEDAVVNGFRDAVRLLPHQILGRAWMKDREDLTKKRTGGILADDMGLGKTIQTLTRIVEGRPRKSDSADGWDAATLVVCPLALVGQWSDEIQKMAKGLTVVQHQGTARTSDPKNLRRAHVVVTTYDVVKSEYESYNPSAKDESKSKSKSKKKASADSSDDELDSSDAADHFGRTVASKKPAKARAGKKKDALYHLKWWRIVLDEAHNIKNQKTKAAIACCELEGKFRWCLTGTPMQNNVTELYSLIKFLRIKPLSIWEEFNDKIAKPVKNGRGANRAMKRLQVVLKQIMLRRRKDQTLNGKVLIELPERNVNIVSCPFDASERTFYDALANKMESVIEKLMAQSGGKANYTSVLLLLLRLRQACNHPVLVSKDYKTDMDAVEPKSVKKGADDKEEDGDDLAAAFGQLDVTRKCLVCTTALTPNNTAADEWETHCVDCAPLAIQAKLQSEGRTSSAKIRMILKLLHDIDERAEGEKTIIFSQFTSMLDLIEPFLRDRGIKYVRYDGSMNTTEREFSLSKIKKSLHTHVILISFKAGSTGLNLTACNNVILVDLWWNPALEDQAFDRAHRFGQTRDVNIFKLKVDDTVEDRILELQEKKRELSRAALSGDKIKDMRLGMDDLLALFRPGGRDDEEDDEY